MIHARPHEVHVDPGVYEQELETIWSRSVSTT